MAYGVIMCYHLHMPLYILGTFTEYPSLYIRKDKGTVSQLAAGTVPLPF